MLIQNLSPQQIEAVNAIDEDVEIIVWAGVGKTGVAGICFLRHSAKSVQRNSRADRAHP